MTSGSSPRASALRRLAALLEIVGVFIVGTLVARLASRALALGPAGLRSLEPGQSPDYVQLSVSTGANLLVRYGLLLGLAFVVGWWHRQRRLAAYGVTTAGGSLKDHLGTALLLFATASLLPILLKFLAGIAPMGPVPPHWQLIESVERPGLWLYLFVGSFGVVPVVEELFFRGYVQTRLAEDFGAAAAILITALFFTFAHTQYFIAGPVGVGMLASLLIASVAAGYVRHRTGSLAPVIVAHALGNLPFRGWGEPVVLGLMALVVVVWFGPISRYAIQLRHDVVSRAAGTAALAGVVVFAIVLAQVLLAPASLPFSGTLALGAALALESRERRTSRAPVPGA